MKKIHDLILEPNDSDNKIPSYLNSTVSKPWWLDGPLNKNKENYNLSPKIPTYKSPDRVKVVHTTTKETLVGKIVGRCTGHVYRVLVETRIPEFTCWASANPLNKQHDYIIQNKITV